MILRPAPLALALAGCLVVSACQRDAPPPPIEPEAAQRAADTEAQARTAAETAEADAFVARVNDTLRADYPEQTAAQWLSQTYIGPDSATVAAKATERGLAQLGRFVEESRRFEGLELTPATGRALQLLKLATPMPAPNDPQALAELTRIATRLDQAYGAGTYCREVDGERQCRQLGALEEVLADPASDYAAHLDAWSGWHAVAVPMRADYQRFVELSNQGARDLGFADTGALWRSGYDMDADAFREETDRLWGQVKPLYDNLQCYVRTRLVQKYGEQGEIDGKIPAHLTGNMWAQQWGNLWPLVMPYRNEPQLSITPALQAQREALLQERLTALGRPPSPADRVELEREVDLAMARAMTERAQDFYVSLGLPALPESFWERSQLVRPRDRDVVCHASAWSMDFADDVRIKMCIRPTEEDFLTIYHELGHIYYYIAYKEQPPLFQAGANDGFHEAIGDTVVLSMTPEYLASIGLIDAQRQSNEALINAQMKMALDKVAFLPFGLLIDRWRWGVFDGSIAPGEYNAAWWRLRAQYQGVAPPEPRGEEFFDAGAKYHVPGNTPYTRYFLSHILQFQFYRALCEAAGHQGPLHACNIHGNAEAGAKFRAMLAAGASQPWQQTIRELTGREELDASAILDYFQPLSDWLSQQNQGHACGWPEGGGAPAARTAAR
ncbi:M2 family metallopeptidase [Coralloluteibacterium thermophilus]|uniref:M2 family metallopeptidase n=1 Tax=Coralloluteibacterium thermophilum TaxID=2707049 RepID=A0ABV9NM36_9GAMM